jgi:sugar lactone lactonase YvrE
VELLTRVVARLRTLLHRSGRRASVRQLDVDGRRVAAVSARLGENPRWDPASQSVYWIDIPAGLVHRHMLATGANYSWHVGGELGAMQLGADGRLLLAIGQQLVWFDARTAAQEPWRTIDVLDARTCRFNDAAWAPDGSLWIGSMDRDGRGGRGALFRVPSVADEAPVTILVDGFSIVNGPVFDRVTGRAYVADSPRRVVYALEPEFPARRTVFARFGADEGFPDGMAVDARGNLWVAHFAGERLSLWSTRGERLAEVPLPGSCPTALALIGDSEVGIRAAVTTSDHGAFGPGGLLLVTERGVPAIED